MKPGSIRLCFRFSFPAGHLFIRIVQASGYREKELKVWEAVVEFPNIISGEDNSLPTIPNYYRETGKRINVKEAFSYFSWVVIIGTVLLFLIALGGWRILSDRS